MGETLGRWENMASPGTRGKSVGVVLAEAEYIIRINEYSEKYLFLSPVDYWSDNFDEGKYSTILIS